MTSSHTHPSHPPHSHPHPTPHHHDSANTNPPLPTPTAASAGVAVSAAATTTTLIGSIPNNTAVSATNTPRVRLMCSYGGRILPRPGDHLLRYVGGETRIVSFPRNPSFSTFLSLLSSLSPALFSPKSPPVIKYQLPNEDLDALISVSSDDDLINMLDEFDRLNAGNPASSAIRTSPRLRLFLFPSAAFGSVLSTAAGGESNQWFLEALNSTAPPPLERRRSEASSSVLSDPPDYLFGLDTGSDRSPPEPDSEPTEPAEPVGPVERVLSVQSQEVPSTPHPQPAQPVYYVPQPVPLYYLPAAVSYLPPSVDGHVPVQGFIQVPGPVYFGGEKEAQQYVTVAGRGYAGGSYGFEQPAAAGYVRAPFGIPAAAMYPPQPAGPVDSAVKQQAIAGSDGRSGRTSQ